MAEGRYVKKGIAGEGTFGVVYRAWDTKEDREVAIKKLRMGREKEGIDFTALREIKVLQEMQHPNILRVRRPHRPDSLRLPMGAVCVCARAGLGAVTRVYA